MPRSSRGSAGPRSAPSRPAAPTPSRAPAPQQQRPMTTAARPPTTTQQAPPPAMQQQGKSPGLFGQMASTAAGVAVGSSIGHAIGGMFGGGWGGSNSQAEAAPEATYQQPVDSYAQPGQAMDQGYYNSQAASRSEAAGPCANDIKSFTDCMNQNQGNMTICGWYLEQLKACQQAARQY